MCVKILTDEKYLHEILNYIHSAKVEILISVYYAVTPNTDKDSPVRKIIDALIQAHQRGVHISVIFANHNLPASSLQENKKTASLLREHNILTFFFEQRRLLHAKFFLFDNIIAVAGSHNLTDRSLQKSAEVSILTTQTTAVHKLREYFMYMQSKSKLNL